MDVTIKISTGRGAKYALESKSRTIRDVVSIDQVIEDMQSNFKEYFPPQAKLTDMGKGRKKE